MAASKTASWNPFKAYQRALGSITVISDLEDYLVAAIQQGDTKTALEILYRMHPHRDSNRRWRQLVQQCGIECLRDIDTYATPTPLRRFLDSLLIVPRRNLMMGEKSMLRMSLWYQSIKASGRAKRMLYARVNLLKPRRKDLQLNHFLACYGLLIYHRLTKRRSGISSLEYPVMKKHIFGLFKGVLKSSKGPKEVFLYPYVEALLVKNKFKKARRLIKKYRDLHSPNSESYYHNLVAFKSACKRMMIKMSDHMQSRKARKNPLNMNAAARALYTSPIDFSLSELEACNSSENQGIFRVMTLLDYAPLAKDVNVWVCLLDLLNIRSDDAVSSLLESNLWSLRKSWWKECLFDLGEVQAAFNGEFSSKANQCLSISKALCARTLFGLENDYSVYVSLAVVYSPHYIRPDQLDDLTILLLTMDECYYVRQAEQWGRWIDKETFLNSTNRNRVDVKESKATLASPSQERIWDFPEDDVIGLDPLPNLAKDGNEFEEGERGFCFALRSDQVVMWNGSEMAEIDGKEDEKKSEKQVIPNLVIGAKNVEIAAEMREIDYYDSITLPFWSRRVVVPGGNSGGKRQQVERHKCYCDFCAVYRLHPTFDVANADGNIFQVCGHCIRRVGSTSESVTAATRFVCSLCSIRQKSIAKLTAHFAVHKRGTTQHECPECGRVLNRHDAWKHHMEIAHGLDADGNKLAAGQHKCDECGRVFDRKQALKNHQTFAHVERRSGVCRICGVSVQYLARHMQVVHRRVAPRLAFERSRVRHDKRAENWKDVRTLEPIVVSESSLRIVDLVINKAL